MRRQREAKRERDRERGKREDGKEGGRERGKERKYAYSLYAYGFVVQPYAETNGNRKTLTVPVSYVQVKQNHGILLFAVAYFTCFQH